MKKYESHDYAQFKKSFDQVMEQYAQAAPSVRAVNMAGSSGGSANPANPTIVDFRVDVEEQVKKVIKNKKHLTEFIVRYTLGVERLSVADQHLFARYEQRLGRLFIDVGLHPLGQYFITQRKRRMNG